MLFQPCLAGVGAEAELGNFRISCVEGREVFLWGNMFVGWRLKVFGIERVQA